MQSFINFVIFMLLLGFIEVKSGVMNRNFSMKVKFFLIFLAFIKNNLISFLILLSDDQDWFRFIHY